MALYELVLKSVYFGQQCVNRWNYVGTGTPAAVTGSFAMVSAFGAIASGTPAVFPTGTVFSQIREITSNLVEFNEIIAMNVYDPTDFYTTAFPDNTNGIVASGGGSPFEAMGFRTNIVNRLISRGTKRFVGMPINSTGDGGTINPTHIAAMEILAARMTANLSYDDEGNTLTFAPCVVSKLKYTTPSGKSAYKYYTTLTEQMNHVAQGIAWEVYDTIRSQTSRQAGHGK